MAKPEPYRLKLSNRPFTIEIPPRFFEEGRARLQGDHRIATCDSILATRNDDGAASISDEWRALIKERQAAGG